MTTKKVFAMSFIFALLLAAPATLAAKPTPDTLEVSPERQAVSLPDDPTAIYSITLRNNADVDQEFEIGSYTPRYYGDPGFTYHFEYNGEVMPMVFYLTLAAGEEVPIVLVVTAYNSADEVPEFWVTVTAFGPITTGWVDTFTIRTASKGNKPI